MCVHYFPSVCHFELKIEDSTSRLKLYVAKTLQKFSVPCVEFVVSRQWTIVQFPIRQLVFMKDMSP